MKKILILAFQLFYFIPCIQAQSGNVGVNTLTPQGTLHVVRNAPSGGPLLTNAMAIFEDNQSSFIHLSHPNTLQSGILSGNVSTLIRSGIVFGTDSSVMLRSGGNTTRMTIAKNGNVGINTTAPNNSALLEMNSTSKGLLIPRMTSAQRIAIPTPGPGLMVYDLTAKTIFLHDGTQWQPFAMMSANVQDAVHSSQPTITFNDAEFGFDVALDGSKAIVGAPQNETSANLPKLNIGTATLYSGPGGWTEVSTQVYPSPMDDDQFGWSVDINGNYAIVGVPYDDGVNTNQGGARIYFFNGTSWAFQSQLNEAGTNHLYGTSVSLQNENIAAVGIPGFSSNGKVDIYTRTGVSWTQMDEIETSIDNTGSHVELSGNKILVGAFAPNSGVGRFYIFYNNGTSWDQEFESPPLSVYSVAFQGNYVTLGTGGSVIVYWYNGVTWVQQATLISNDFNPADEFGRSVAIDGEYIMAGAPGDGIGSNANQGSAYVFKRNGSSWIQVAKITDSEGTANAEFGYSLDISGHQYVIGSRAGNNSKGAVSFGTLY